MRTRTVALTAAILCLPLTACSSSDDGNKPKPSVSNEDAPADSAKADTGKPMPLGKAAETAGSPNPVDGPGGGMLQITPTTVTYTKAGTSESPENDEFAVIAYTARSTKAVAAAESAPIENGGWEWVAPDGQAVDTLSGNATNVTPHGYASGGTVKPGTYQQRAVAFDITTAQQGGTLTYTDGDGTTWRWTMPAKDTGPELAKLKAALG